MHVYMHTIAEPIKGLEFRVLAYSSYCNPETCDQPEPEQDDGGGNPKP